MPKKIHCIINPKASGGRTKKLWETKAQSLLGQSLGPFTWEFTKHKGEGVLLGKSAVNSGADLLIIMGGDGTISEAVNGCLQSKIPAKNLPPIGLLNSGSGGDFCRSLGIPANLDLSIDRIKNGKKTTVDAGHLHFFSFTGEPQECYFINAASFGLSGDVVHTVENSSKNIWGDWNYLAVSMQRLFIYKKPLVRISWDQGPFSSHRILTHAVCNGSFFGGGMQIAPKADIHDGFFETATIENWNIFRALWNTKHVYKGSLGKCRGVSFQAAREVRVEALDTKSISPIFVECDGECLGVLPIQAKIIPKALRFCV